MSEPKRPMTAHELARILLDGPDLPVTVIGQCAMEGLTVDLTKVKRLDAVRRTKWALRPDYATKGDVYEEEDLAEYQKEGCERLHIIQLS